MFCWNNCFHILIKVWPGRWTLVEKKLLWVQFKLHRGTHECKKWPISNKTILGYSICTDFTKSLLYLAFLLCKFRFWTIISVKAVGILNVKILCMSWHACLRSVYIIWLKICWFLKSGLELVLYFEWQVTCKAFSVRRLVYEYVSYKYFPQININNLSVAESWHDIWCIKYVKDL